MTTTGCLNPAHAEAPQDHCGGCASDCEAELTRLRDQQMRQIHDRRAWEKRVVAASRRTAHDDVATWVGLYHIGPAMASLSWPLEETLGGMTMVDPEWGRTKDQRARLSELKVRAEQSQKRYWEIVQAAEPAWRADPNVAEVERLRGIITEHGQRLHKQQAPTPGQCLGEPCTCPGCVLIRAMDMVMPDLADEEDQASS